MEHIERVNRRYLLLTLTKHYGNNGKEKAEKILNLEPKTLSELRNEVKRAKEGSGKRVKKGKRWKLTMRDRKFSKLSKGSIERKQICY